MEFIDTLQIIFNFCDFRSQLSLVTTCTYYRNNLHIIDLLNIDKKYLKKLTQEILRYSIFEKVIYLNASNNFKITNVSHMKSLQILHAEGDCGINQQEIKGLNLIKLDASYNSKITNVSHMESLQILHACGGNCGINQQGIEGLNLLELYARKNPKITDVSQMKYLQILDASSYDCGIDQKRIEGLNLIKLYAKIIRK